jgi:hypothetical protein
LGNDHRFNCYDDLEKKFPGFKANKDGMSMDVEKAAKTTKDWRH